jgi:hypothetical protein
MMKLEIRFAALLAALLLATASLVPGGAEARDRGADGRFATRRSSHFVLYQDVDIDRSSGWGGSVEFEKQLLATLERAHGSLEQLLGLRPGRDVEVWVYDPAIFDAQFGGRFRFPVAGFYHGAVRVRCDVQLTRQLSRVLHHELVHAAFDLASPSYRLPAWVNEGTAEWFENRADGKRRLSPAEWGALAGASRRGAWIPLPALLPPTFGGMPPEAVGLAYLQSYASIDLLVRRRGERGLESFLHTLLRLRDPDRALRRVYRMDSAELQETLRAELR